MATTYYVDAKNGKDTSGDGSAAQPWWSLSYAHGRMAAGDTLRLRGKLNDPETFYTGAPNLLVVSKPGVTIRADEGHRPVIDGGWGPDLLRPIEGGHKFASMYTHVMPDPYGANKGNFADGTKAYNVAGTNSRFAAWFLIQADGVTIDGLTFQNIDRNVVKGDGNQLTVRRCNFYWFIRQAVITRMCSGTTIEWCNFVQGTLMRMRAHPDGPGANAWFNYFPMQSNAAKLTPDGYTGVVRYCYSDLTHGDGLLIQQSDGTASAPFLFERNVLVNGEGFYPVSSEHVIFRHNVVFNTEGRDQYKPAFEAGLNEPSYLNKDEKAKGGASHDYIVAGNLFVNARGPLWNWSRGKLDKPGIPRVNSNIYFGGNTVILTDQVGVDIKLSDTATSKVGPFVIENNVLCFTKWGPTPQSRSGGPEWDMVYRSNAQLTSRPGFSDALITSRDGLKLRNPGATLRSVNPPPSTFGDGQKPVQNWADVEARLKPNYGLPMPTLTDIDLRNYTPEQGSPLVGAARAYQAVVYGPNTTITLAVPRWVNDSDVWSHETGPRKTIGAFEYGTEPSAGIPAPDPPDEPDPEPEPEPDEPVVELEFSNGWAIVADGDLLRLRDPDGDLWDWELTAV